MSGHIIDIQRLHKSFQSGKQELRIISDLQLQVSSGTSVVISGESGAGKSTLLHIVGGLDGADSGQVHVAHHRLHTLNEYQLAVFRNAQIGFVFQSYHLLSDFNALENIMMPALIAGAKRAPTEESARSLLDAVRLGPRADHFPAQLSGGEQQRIAFARALINNPTVILADEPTGNLDEENSRIIERMLFDLVRQFRKTLLVVSHDRHIAALAEEHLVLTHGKLHRP